MNKTEIQYCLLDVQHQSFNKFNVHTAHVTLSNNQLT